ncbi:hypothetical protein PGT21_022199 [Puccinia graminis f. sp. tritici]|uniref:Uncharacterized protein n=1 Tax=Puccinia graminis f. sp. tritici TaxID=56615 RepID=A0A5B0MA23_PUCGR|nr:hypothetical protein PGT21_022199 [Puccinia graminis f. sp. tritici]
MRDDSSTRASYGALDGEGPPPGMSTIRDDSSTMASYGGFDQEGAGPGMSHAPHTEPEISLDWNQLRAHSDRYRSQGGEAEVRLNWNQMRAEDLGFGHIDANQQSAEEFQIDWDKWILHGIKDIILEEERMPGDEEEEEVEDEDDSIPTAWFPFKNRDYLIGSLIVGYLHNTLSRALYHQLRMILTLCRMKLPHWNALRRCRENIRKIFHVSVNETESVFLNKCYALSIKQMLANELSNPYVRPHLRVYPEDNHGLYQHALYQSKKWREELPYDCRVQMVAHEVHRKHYYIYEPTLLRTGNLVVPIFFFEANGKMYAKVVVNPEFCTRAEDGKKFIKLPENLSYDSQWLSTIPVFDFEMTCEEIKMVDGQYLTDIMDALLIEANNVEVAFPNPWRAKAAGRMIRHVPITLYSDDTSGNVSKQWNKHVSYYFTLSGLPPNHTNQEYNCHFISTSNVAGPLELAEQIVDEMNDLATNGHPAFDSSIHEEVLVMSVVLCFLADSPMHAEITSTPNPGSANNPCRMCKLTVGTREERQTLSYVCQCMGISPHTTDVSAKESSNED